jgi:hypothetical protein
MVVAVQEEVLLQLLLVLTQSMRPYVEKGLSEAQKLYETYTPQYYGGQTYVSPSAQTESALTMAEQQARAGSPLINQALAQQQGAVGGQYLGANPYLTSSIKTRTRSSYTSI